MSNNIATVIIPKKLSKKGDLVLISKSELEELLAKAAKVSVTEKEILRWSKEAKILRRAHRLPILRSLRDLR